MELDKISKCDNHLLTIFINLSFGAPPVWVQSLPFDLTLFAGDQLICWACAGPAWQQVVHRLVYDAENVVFWLSHLYAWILAFQRLRPGYFFLNFLIPICIDNDFFLPLLPFEELLLSDRLQHFLLRIDNGVVPVGRQLAFGPQLDILGDEGYFALLYIQCTSCWF